MNADELCIIHTGLYSWQAFCAVSALADILQNEGALGQILTFKNGLALGHEDQVKRYMLNEKIKRFRFLPNFTFYMPLGWKEGTPWALIDNVMSIGYQKWEGFIDSEVFFTNVMNGIEDKSKQWIFRMVKNSRKQIMNTVIQPDGEITLVLQNNDLGIGPAVLSGAIKHFKNKMVSKMQRMMPEISPDYEGYTVIDRYITVLDCQLSGASPFEASWAAEAEDLINEFIGKQFNPFKAYALEYQQKEVKAKCSDCVAKMNEFMKIQMDCWTVDLNQPENQKQFKDLEAQLKVLHSEIIKKTADLLLKMTDYFSVLKIE